jgi:hypothetical protein
MHKIYNQAERCMIWLGKGTPQSKLAFEKLMDWVQNADEVKLKVIHKCNDEFMGYTLVMVHNYAHDSS